MKKNFYNQYFYKINRAFLSIDIHMLEKLYNLILKTSKSKGTIFLFGNGANISTASHAATDFTKNAKIKTISLNDSNLITCFSNDYGYERWIEKAIDFYAESKDVLILISSSGKSPNMINACKAARNKKISKIITFTDHNKDNQLSKLGDINLWIDSKAYNFVENTHQIWLLTIVDLIIGNREYLPS